MLNKENNNLFTTDCISCLPLVWIACPKENHGTAVIMTSITEEQEQELDNDVSIVVEDQFDRTFIVNPKFCYAYGKLDLSPNSADVHKIADNNLFSGLYISINMLTRYDYESHTVTSDVKGGRWYETQNPELFLPFLHGQLGKPERVVIFRRDFDIIANRKRSTNSNRQANHIHYHKCKDYYKEYNRKKLVEKRKAKVSSLQFKIKKQL